MAKQTFAAKTFASKTFACGTYNGVGAVVTGVPVRTFNLWAAAGTTFNLWASAMSVQSNIAFFQGEDLTLNFTLAPPTDITGWTIAGTVKDKLGGTVQFNPTVAITDAGRGKYQAVWPRASTSALSPGDYTWDTRRTDSGSNTLLAHGEATCRQPVTP